MPCNDFYIQSALEKITKASIGKKGCRLTNEECRSISFHDQLGDAFGSYSEWKFDEDGQHLDESTT